MIRKGMFISDRYEIIDKVGSGGMSDVYKAMDHKLNRYVAIKVLKSEFSEDTGFVSKFKVEAQSAAGLTHPNIVNVYDVGEDNGIYYIVMELIEGITLKKYIEKKGKLPIKEAVSIAIQVAQGIEAAHNNHIIHRDIKPQNIMISREGKVKVTDFGIARAASSHTINGNAMGSVHYISPEQAKGGYIDEKSDIYSLGISLFEMITGEVPFEGDSTVSVALQHINEEMPNPRDYVEELPISVEKILAKCTQKKPERRYLKVSTLIADLKKSLITPDEDFVQMAPASENGTVVLLSKDEAPVIKKNPANDDLSDKTEEGSYDDSLSDDDDVFGTDDDIDSVSPKLDKIITISGIVGAVVVAIVVILVLIKAFGGCDSESKPIEDVTKKTEQNTLSDKQTIVPNVVGKAEDDAIDELQKSDLGFKIDKRESSNSYPKGYVMEQSVAKDTVVDKHTTVLLTISEGPKEITIPDVKNKPKTEAQKLLEGEEYGLVVTFDYEISDEIEIDNVIRTEPEIGAAAKYGDSIKLIVSQGTDTSEVEVPKLEDKTEERAREELAELGLTLKVVEERNSDTIEKGRIINQSIASGKSVPRGTEIGVVISLGKEPESTTPEPTTEPPTEAPTPADKVATFAKVSASKFKDIPSTVKDKDGKDIPITGTVSAEVKYKLGTGIYSEPVKLEEKEIAFSKENWEISQKTISSKEVEVGTEVTMTVTLTYVTYVNEGTEEEPKWTEKKETATVTTDPVVFQ